jgi:hypothetical protein
MTKGFAIVWLVLVTTGIGRGQDRDKSGTTTLQKGSPLGEVLENKGQKEATQNETERAGFSERCLVPQSNRGKQMEY